MGSAGGALPAGGHWQDLLGKERGNSAVIRSKKEHGLIWSRAAWGVHHSQFILPAQFSLPSSSFLPSPAVRALRWFSRCPVIPPGRSGHGEAWDGLSTAARPFLGE